MKTFKRLMAVFLATSLSACGGGSKTAPNPATAPTEPVYAPVDVSTDPDLLLRLVFGGPYMDPIPSQYIGDASMYWETRFPVFRGVPSNPGLDGGFKFSSTESSFIAVPDGFLSGLKYSIEFFAYIDSDGTIVGSNWAGPNPGDWLLQVEKGFLRLMLDGVWFEGPSLYTGVRYNFRISFVGGLVAVYVNGVDIVSGPFSGRENGSPLVFGGNAYDRLEGLHYFSGVIGGINIRRE